MIKFKDINFKNKNNYCKMRMNYLGKILEIKWEKGELFGPKELIIAIKEYKNYLQKVGVVLSRQPEQFEPQECLSHPLGFCLLIWEIDPTAVVVDGYDPNDYEYNPNMLY